MDYCSTPGAVAIAYPVPHACRESIAVRSRGLESEWWSSYVGKRDYQEYYISHVTSKTEGYFDPPSSLIFPFSDWCRASLSSFTVTHLVYHDEHHDIIRILIPAVCRAGRCWSAFTDGHYHVGR